MNVELGAINLANTATSGDVQVSPSSQPFTYSTEYGQAVSPIISIDNAGGNVILNGSIDNPNGTTTIQAGGTIAYATPAVSPAIVTNKLELDSGGSMGSSSQYLNVDLHDAAGTPSITKLSAGGTAFLNLLGLHDGTSGGPVTIDGGNWTAGSFALDIGAQGASNGLGRTSLFDIQSFTTTATTAGNIAISDPDGLASLTAGVSLAAGGALTIATGGDVTLSSAGNLNINAISVQNGDISPRPPADRSPM